MRFKVRAAVGAVALGASATSFGGTGPGSGPYAFDTTELHAGFLDAPTLATACAREQHCGEGSVELQSFCENLDVLVSSGAAAAQAELAATHLGALVSAMGTASSRDEAALHRRLDEAVADLRAALEMTRVAIAERDGSYGDMAIAARNLTHGREQLSPALALATGARSGHLASAKSRSLPRLRDAAGLAAAAADTLTRAGYVLAPGEAPDPVEIRATALREQGGLSCGTMDPPPVVPSDAGSAIDPLAVGATLWGAVAPADPLADVDRPWRVRRALALWCPTDFGAHGTDALALFGQTCTLYAGSPDAFTAAGLPLLQTALRADLAALPRRLGEETLLHSHAYEEGAWQARDIAASNTIISRMVELVLSGAAPADALASLARARPAIALTVGSGGAALSVRRTPMASALYIGSAAFAALPSPNAVPTEGVTDRLWAAGALIAEMSHSPGLTEGVTGTWNVTPEDVQRVARVLARGQSERGRVGGLPDGVNAAVAETVALIWAASAEAEALQAVFPGTQWPQPGRDDWATALPALASELGKSFSAVADGDPARGAVMALQLYNTLRPDHQDPAHRAVPAVSAAVAVAMAPDASSARAALALAGEPIPKRRLEGDFATPYARLNLYAGAGGGVELGGGEGSAAAWPTVAVGPEIGLRLGEGALGLFAPLLDPAALATWRVSKSDVQNADSFSLLPMFTPGLDLVYALPRVPVSVGLGASLVPGLRQDVSGDSVTVVRGGLFVALDVPLVR